MAAEYQESDWQIVDYRPFCLDEGVIDRSTKRPLFIRGPRPERLESLPQNVRTKTPAPAPEAAFSPSNIVLPG